MGTNYYVIKKQARACAHCGHSQPAEMLHVGKSSGGWAFMLHVVPELGINTLEDWRPLLEQMDIVNEYGDKVSAEQMLRVITGREQLWPFPTDSNRPLQRSKVDGVCIGHGPGTYDYIVGDFS